MLKLFFAPFVFILLFTQSSAPENKKITLAFSAILADSILRSDSPYFKHNIKDSIQIETLKFYISGIAFLKNNNISWREQISFHLLDISVPASMNIEINVPFEISFDELKFNLGIDSITNVSGVMGGDLDPTKGMYWTWQNGYINFKLEGKSNLCPTRKNEFQFHLGGYQFPFNALQTVNLNVKQSDKLNVVFDLKKLIATIDLQKQNQIMSPTKEAVLLSKKVANAFRIK